MPVQLSVKVRGQLVAKRFEDFTGEIKKVGAGRLRGRLLSAQKKVSAYPARYSGTPVHKWASDKQRRYVMWAIKTGRIQYPYQRTGRFGSSWSVQKVENGYRLHSDYPAAKYISGSAYGDQPQYHLHRTRWATLRASVEEAMEALPNEIQEDIVMVARREGLKR